MKYRYDMLVQGVYIVTARHGKKRGGLALAWATQADRNRVAICVGSQSATRPLIIGSRAFGFHVLARGQERLAKRFGTASSARVDKFAGLAVRTARTGSPLLRDCLIWFDCRVERVSGSGDHKVIIGRMVAGGRGRRRGRPLVYRQEDY